MLSSSSFREEGVEGVITATDGFITGHLAIRLDAVLEAEELPASVTGLDTGLTDMDRNTFTHFYRAFGCDGEESGPRREDL